MDLIEQLIKQGKKSWIQEKTKEELIEIANILAKETKFLDTHTIKDVRKYLREYVDRQKTEVRPIRLMMNSITSLEVFTGGNWNAYQQQFECFIVLNDIPEEKKVPLLITKLSTNVYDLLTTLCTPISPVTETYKNICEILRKYYHPLKNYALYQAEFRSRCQKSNETIDQYVMELKKLSKYCNFKNLNEEIKERLLNGPTWTSEKFKNFCKMMGVNQTFTPTYYPSTNGLAERFVESFKSHVVKIVESGYTVEYACNLFLFDYRNTVHKTTGQSPAKLMFGRELRCRFSLLRPNPVADKIDTEQVKLTINSKNTFKTFTTGEMVMVRDHRKNKNKWSLGKIIEVLIPGVTYMVDVDGLNWKRHVNQLLKCGQTLE